tara:strand:+ start:364 stop:516 length:153 start_codon:yes stop_codon:yes gene_type:complete
MYRYYVEFAPATGHSQREGKNKYIYIYAYSEQHVRDMLDDYDLVAIDQTD